MKIVQKNKNGNNILSGLKIKQPRRWNRNKVQALVLIITGLIPAILFGEATIAIFTTIIGVGVYFTKSVSQFYKDLEEISSDLNKYENRKF